MTIAPAALAVSVALASWQELAPGLELGRFAAPPGAACAPAVVRVLRVDPARFELVLLNASAPGEGEARSARGWCAAHGLVAATNAGMFQTDWRTAVGLMRSSRHVNNPRLGRDRAVLAFEPLRPGVPPVQIIDREKQDFPRVRASYGSLVQGIRMVSLDGRNVWSPQERRASLAAVAMDRRGRPLLVHVAEPCSTHDAIELLLALPLDLRNAMYLEGGKEAQLHVRAGGEEAEAGAGADGDDGGGSGWPIPNALGVRARKGGAGAADPPRGRGKPGARRGL